MKIVILDGYTLNPGDLSWEELKKYGEVTIYDRTSISNIDEINSRIKDADIVLTNKTPLSKETIESTETLKYIGVLATGYNVVDVKTAKERNIIVSNIPVYGTSAVAQFAIALLLEVCHHIGEHSKSVHDGEWGRNVDWCFWNYPLIELSGKNIGIIGYGNIGQATGKIAQALGMNVLAYDLYKNEELISDTCRYVELEELWNESDVISLHCPLLKDNEEIINKDTIDKMKDNVIIINNSRGKLINEKDLANALNNGKVLGSGLDVVSIEPIKDNNPLLKAKNCFITPHISWAPRESRSRLLNTAIDNVKAFVNGNPKNVVN